MLCQVRELLNPKSQSQTDRCSSANQYHTSADFPEDYPPNLSRTSATGKGNDVQTDEVWSRGGSCMVNPLGEVLAGPLWDEEGIIYADVRFYHHALKICS